MRRLRLSMHSVYHTIEPGFHIETRKHQGLLKSFLHAYMILAGVV